MTIKQVIRESIETLWLGVSILSLMCEPREDLSALGLVLYYLVVLGNIAAAWGYFGRHGAPHWLSKIANKKDNNINK